MFAADIARIALRCAAPGSDAGTVGASAARLRQVLRDAAAAEVDDPTRVMLANAPLMSQAGLDPVSLATAVAALAGATDERGDRWAWALTAAVAAAVVGPDPRRWPDPDRVALAALLGAEVNCRLWTMMTPDHRRVWTAAGSVGPIGAALTGALLLELDAARATHALAIASSTTLGHRTHDGTGAAVFQAAAAAGNGVLAAHLAAAGVTGSATAIEGPRGLLTAYGAPSARAATDAASTFADFGRRWVALAGPADGQPDPTGEAGWLGAELTRVRAKVAACLTT